MEAEDGYWGRTALYRLFNREDVLLYVGISNDPEVRMGQHSNEKHWWPQVSRHVIEWFPRRIAAADAEVTAIQTEGPLYNQMHSTVRTPPRQHGDGGGTFQSGAAKVTTEIFSTTAAMANLAWVTRSTSNARWELDELPVTFLTRHGTKAIAIVPVWLGEWVVTHADEVFASIKAERAKDES